MFEASLGLEIIKQKMYDICPQCPWNFYIKFQDLHHFLNKLLTKGKNGTLNMASVRIPQQTAQIFQGLRGNGTVASPWWSPQKRRTSAFTAIVTQITEDSP